MSEQREQNKVFTPTNPQIDPGIVARSTADVVKQDFDIEIPVESVPLPSRGVLYSANSPLHMKESVDIKAMTATQEDILTSKVLIKKGTVVHELIRSCLIDKSINVNELVAGDLNTLMVAIRATGYGSDYDAELECGKCEAKGMRNFDLSKLPLKFLKIEPIVQGTNEFEFVLPNTKKKIRFKFLTTKDDAEMTATSEKQKKLGIQADNGVTMMLLHSILSVDGITDRSKISSFIRMIPAKDSLALRNYIKDNEPGISMKQETECPLCGEVEEVTMPVGVSFLWPNASR